MGSAAATLTLAAKWSRLRIVALTRLHDCSAGLKRAFEIIGPALKRAIYEAWGPMRYEY